ncbi:MAG: 1-acyl-sn-glycerol-3-phosphate acyltransferase [Candidatus Cyclobacteriaceae bacterium M3_2C_046]
MKPVEKVDTKKHYDPILPGPGDWPVVQLSQRRKQFVEEVVEEAMKRIKSMRPKKHQLVEELEVTQYKERLRIKQNPWKVDPEDEYLFWEGVKSRLVNITGNFEKEEKVSEDEILKSIITRYAEEVAGKFKKSSFRMARTLVTFGFARLLNAARIKKFGSFFRNELTLQDKIHITGSTEIVRDLAKIGTVVMVPTHFSNLDSVVIGWVIHTLGLPPFIYGAGLNLFNIEIFAYFMNSLGAYKVDRRKKNLIYLETLKAYSTQALIKGCHSIFFPGGTRSRSGKIEKRLKLGLLGTAIEAQRIMLDQQPEGQHNKIFIVPVALNYHFVLEAPVLINEYLQQKGQERYYVENDEYSTSYKIIKFLFKFFTEGSDISVSIGKPMDLFGNYVDQAGNSYDKHGRKVNLRDYFSSNGKITLNYQREMEYTRMLSERLVREYHCISRVFSSHLVAFVAFKMLQKKYYKLDLYNLLRLPEEEQVFDYKKFRDTFSKIRDAVFKLYEQDKVSIAYHLQGDLDQVIDLGLQNVGLYHSKRPLLKNKEGNIISQDLNTLYYYHNRMDGYGLEKYI